MSVNNNFNSNCSWTIAPVSSFTNAIADQHLSIMLISFLLCLLAIIVIIMSQILHDQFL